MDLGEKAKQLITQNFEATGKKYICPSWPHYKAQFLWDSCFHAISCAELGFLDLAKNEIRRLLNYQQPPGWIPNQIFHQRKWYILESYFYKKEHRKYHSSITQPPAIAQAVQAINDQDFTQEVLQKLIKFYCYFIESRDPDQDSLISICHPCETRDASPELAEIVPKFKGPLRILNSLYWPGVLKLEREYQKLDWDINKIWQADWFNAEDLMFNCVWIEGIRALQELGNNRAIQKLIQYADHAQNTLYELCWDKEDKIFYSLDSQNKKIKSFLTISNLFPLILDNLPKEMADSLLEHLTNPKRFWTAFPIPCVSISDYKYSWISSQLRKLLHWHWGYPFTWINTNWWILQGLIKQGYLKIAKQLSDKTLEMVEKEDFKECYDPFTGKGIDASDFSWSTLVVTFPKILQKGSKK